MEIGKKFIFQPVLSVIDNVPKEMRVSTRIDHPGELIYKFI